MTTNEGAAQKGAAQKGAAQKVAVVTPDAPMPMHGAPYSQGTRFGDLVFASGQLPVDPATGTVTEQTIEAQTERTLRNLSAILEAAGSSMEKVLRATVYLTSRDDWAAMNSVYRRMFGEPFPARTAITVAALPFGALLEIDAIAHR